MHTARRTTASISEGFDDESALCCNLVSKINRCWLGKCWLGKTLDVRAALSEQFFYAVKEDIAAWLRNIEKRDGVALDVCGAYKQLSCGRIRLAGRIKNGESSCHVFSMSRADDAGDGIATDGAICPAGNDG